jgi:hypothetical protein
MPTRRAGSMKLPLEARAETMPKTEAEQRRKERPWTKRWMRMRVMASMSVLVL